MPTAVKKTAEKISLGKRIKEDPAFRSSLLEKAVLLINLGYALFNAVLGVYYRSYWFTSMAAWYLIIGLLRLLIVRNDVNVPRQMRRAARDNSKTENDVIYKSPAQML